MILTPSMRDYPRPYILRALDIFRKRDLTSIVEIGCARMPLGHPLDELHQECCMDGHSTAYWLQEEGADVTIVDVEPLAISRAKELATRYPRTGPLEIWCQDGIDFLRSYVGKIDLLFLDAWDADRPASAAKHMQAFMHAEKNLHEQSLVLIDDTDCRIVGNQLHYDETGLGGKGADLIPYAFDHGWKIVFSGRQTLLERE